MGLSQNFIYQSWRRRKPELFKHFDSKNLLRYRFYLCISANQEAGFGFGRLDTIGTTHSLCGHGPNPCSVSINMFPSFLQTQSPEFFKGMHVVIFKKN